MCPFLLGEYYDVLTTKIVGTVCFTIEQQGGNPDISFNMLHTNLNSYNPDNGTNSIAISNFDSIMIVGELACDCSGPGNSCDDNNFPNN